MRRVRCATTVREQGGERAFCSLEGGMRVHGVEVVRLSGAAMAALVVALALPAAGAARATPRIAIGPVKGDARAVVPTQLAEALCGQLECVLWREVSSRRAPDLAKARARDVSGILVGRLERDAEGRTAVLSLLAGSPRPARSWSFRLSRGGRIADVDLQRLEAELAALLRQATARVREGPSPPSPPPPAPRREATRPRAPPRPLERPPASRARRRRYALSSRGRRRRRPRSARRLRPRRISSPGGSLPRQAASWPGAGSSTAASVP